MTVHCMKPGCDCSWPRDPVLEVECPDCGAAIGAKCTNPSGWTKWGTGNFHAARDIAADQAGKYGPCPSGRCGVEESQRTAQGDLFNAGGNP